MPLLDLTGADLSGFTAMPSGTYHAEIHSIKQEGTKGGPDAKLPKGTPKINIRFRVVGKDDEIGEGYEYYNRAQFAQRVLGPFPRGYDKQKVAVMKGMLVKFLIAVGFTEEELNSSEFDIPDWDELSGRSCRIVVKRKLKHGIDPDADDFNLEDEDNFDNEVTDIKAPSAAVAAGGSGLT